MPKVSQQSEQLVIDAAVGGFLDPISRRSAFKMSRLAVLKDGSTLPVLDLLARTKFPEGWSEDQFPFWLDGDWQNETLDNVGLATKVVRHQTTPRSALGVPSGTKEYMRLWRQQNREKVRASQARYAEKQKAVLTKALALAETDPVLEHLASVINDEKETE